MSMSQMYKTCKGQCLNIFSGTLNILKSRGWGGQEIGFWRPCHSFGVIPTSPYPHAREEGVFPSINASQERPRDLALVHGGSWWCDVPGRFKLKTGRSHLLSSQRGGGCFESDRGAYVPWSRHGFHHRGWAFRLFKN